VLKKGLTNAWYFSRTLLFILGMWILSGIIGVLGFFCYLVPYKIRFRMLIGTWSHCMLFIMRIFCGVRYKITGQENIPPFPCVVLSKHSSTWETIALPIMLSTPTIVIKKELLRIPGFGWGLALCEPIVINRTQRKEAMNIIINQGKRYLKLGRQVLLFPEGTRSGGEYKTGGAVLAKEARVPILPIAHTADTCWPRHQFNIKPGTIYVRIGKLIDTQTKTPEEITLEVRGWIEKTVTELKRN
jgi:1-acyl-sn-glycerol-3-phosphate acyltransferase